MPIFYILVPVLSIQGTPAHFGTHITGIVLSNMIDNFKNFDSKIERGIFK
jgi:hypothetical protein